MVRINLLHPKALADQHLIAEYNEILMFFGYVRKYPKLRKQEKQEDLPKTYCLGKGHMLFFRDKLLYLKRRHELLKKEMRKRGFAPAKTVSLKGFPKASCNSWSPSSKDRAIIRKRLIWKLRKKPGYYRYCRKHKPVAFFLGLVRRSS